MPSAANMTRLLRTALLVLLLSVHGLGMAAHAATHTDLGDTVSCEVCSGGNKLDHAAVDCANGDSPRPGATRPPEFAPLVIRDPLGVPVHARGPPLSS